jgi:hypothetical protein
VLPSRPQQGPQAVLHMLRGAGGVDRAELAVEGRQLERKIDPGNAAFVIAVQARHLGPGLNFAGHPLDQLEIGPLIGVGIPLARRRLAQQIEREGETLFTQSRHRRQNFFDLRPGNEPLRHPQRVGPRVERQRLAQHGIGLRNLQPQPHRQRQVRTDFVKILLQMAGDRVVRVQHGQHVDEAEHLHLDRFVGHGPGENAVVPPAPLEDRRTAPFQICQQIPADHLGFGFDGRIDVDGTACCACRRRRSSLSSPRSPSTFL